MKKERIIAFIMILAFLSIAARLVPGMKNLVTDYSHHENHGGNFYSSAYNETLADTEKILILINTTGVSHAHLVGSVRVTGEANVEFWEGATVSALGGALEETNHNRDSANTAGVIVTNTPTLTSAGDRLDGLTQHIGSGQKTGGEARAENEIVLNEDSLYLLNVTSEANSNDTTVMLQWYESSDYY